MIVGGVAQLQHRAKAVRLFAGMHIERKLHISRAVRNIGMHTAARVKAPIRTAKFSSILKEVSKREKLLGGGFKK